MNPGLTQNQKTVYPTINRWTHRLPGGPHKSIRAYRYHCSHPHKSSCPDPQARSWNPCLSALPRRHRIPAWTFRNSRFSNPMPWLSHSTRFHHPGRRSCRSWFPKCCCRRRSKSPNPYPHWLPSNRRNCIWIDWETETAMAANPAHSSPILSRFPPR